MTRYDVYIPMPRLHLIFFGKVWEKLLMRLRHRISMDILILEQVKESKENESQ